MKVGYLMLSGHESTAYLDDDPDDLGIYHGENKHSDEPVAVRWTGERWEEVER
jgi:hypothetical protein